jgi:restriction endonuclease S subunit
MDDIYSQATKPLVNNKESCYVFNLTEGYGRFFVGIGYKYDEIPERQSFICNSYKSIDSSINSYFFFFFIFYCLNFGNNEELATYGSICFIVPSIVLIFGSLIWFYF